MHSIIKHKPILAPLFKFTHITQTHTITMPNIKRNHVMLPIMPIMRHTKRDAHCSVWSTGYGCQFSV